MTSKSKMAGAFKVRYTFLTLIGLLYLNSVVTGNDLVVPTSPTASVYTWQQPVEGDWTSPSSWAPERIAPAPNDILIFNLGGVTTAANIQTQTIGQLIVTGNTTVNLQSAFAVVLSITGDNGEDLTVATNSALNFIGDNSITCSLATGATAVVNGFIRFSSSSAADHRVTAVDPGAVSFNSGGVFMAMNGFTGNPFGTTNLNSIIFDGGSVYICMAGGDPFGAAAPASVVTFNRGSLFSLQGNVVPSFTGRTYANFEMNYSTSGFLSISASGAMFMDNLTLTAGRLAFYLTGNSGLSIRGDITIGSGTSLQFVSGIFRLNGTTTQTISRFGGQGVAGTSTVVIDNIMGVNITSHLGLNAINLELKNGVINLMDPTSRVSVIGTVVRTNGYVNGLLNRNVFVPGSYVFDVGTENGYSPVTADLTFNDSANLTIGAHQTAQPNISDPSRALSRYWEIFGSSGLTVDLTFHYFDSDIPATTNEQSFVVRKYNGTNFVQEFGVIDTAANTFRVNGITDFYRDWTLVEPGAVVSPTPTASPTATSTPLASVTGTIIYGNAMGAPAQRFVSNVTVRGTGPSTIFTTTIFPSGDYSLTGFQPGAYSVAPSKTGGVNGITSFDAGRIAQHVAGINPLTGNQLVVADVSGNGTISSFDAGQIAKYVAGLSGFGSTGNWIFTPANRSYASVTGNITGEDFTALLMGEVSGNWTNTGAR